jgi:hypothetical protein
MPEIVSLENQNNKEEQRQIQLEKKRERVRSRRMIESEEQHQNRLEKIRERTRSKRMNETAEERQDRLKKNRERTQSGRINESEEQRENRLEKNRERTRSKRMDGTDEERQDRLKKDRERTQLDRMNESEGQRQHRLEHQRKLSQTNREKMKMQKRVSSDSSRQQQNTDIQFAVTEEHESYTGSSGSDLVSNEYTIKEKKNSIASSWPEPISRGTKENCLKQFLQRMSMTALAEITCGVCNVRTSVKNSKSMSVSKITRFESLKISNETKDLIMNTQPPNLQHTNQNPVTVTNNDNIVMASHAQSNEYLLKIKNCSVIF